MNYEFIPVMAGMEFQCFSKDKMRSWSVPNTHTGRHSILSNNYG